MKILKPNTGDSVIHIPVNNLYFRITDYGAKFFLKQIKIRAGQHTWEWIPLKVDKEVDLSSYGDNLYRSFDKAVNIAINDSYSTVYIFDDFEEVVDKWNEIVYVNNITTVYKPSDKEIGDE